MAKIHHNNVNHHNHNFRLWTSFSGQSFRRKLLDAIACGGASFSCHQHVIKPPKSVGSEKLADILSEYSSETSDSKRSTAVATVKSEREKLSDLLNMSEWSSETCESQTSATTMTAAVTEETRRKVVSPVSLIISEEALEELKRAVKMLQCDDVVEEREKSAVKRAAAAANIRMLAKEDAQARITLAMLGAIPLLVRTIDDDDHLNDVDSKISSLYALLNLAIGNDINKAAIVKAGAVHKMLKLIESSNGSPSMGVSEAIVANFLGLSALDSNKLIIGSSGAIPFLVRILTNSDCTSSFQAKQDSLRALYNLSISHASIPFILETDLIPFLMSSLGDMEISEKTLSILSNVVSTPEGRKVIRMVQDSFLILVDVLNWTDSSECQEKATYILLVMAHKTYGDRQAMIEAGIVSALLELTLLGTKLAQKRASRILECFRVDKGKQISESYNVGSGSTLSAPICGSSSTSNGMTQVSKEGFEEEEGMMSEERKAVKQLVQQSLQNNMKRIVKRANLPQDFVPSDHFKSLTPCSTSKSLPF